MFIHAENNEEIDMPFPKDKFQTHLATLGVKTIKQLTHSKLVTLMGNLIADFRCGKLSIDELSSCFSHLWSDFYLKRKDDRFFEIGNVLEAGSELAYYVRHAVDAEGKPNTTFTGFLYEIFHFYDLRDSILRNVREMEKEQAH